MTFFALFRQISTKVEKKSPSKVSVKRSIINIVMVVLGGRNKYEKDESFND